MTSGVNIYDPATGALKDHLTGLNALGYTLSTQLAPTLAGELAFYGIQKLGESIGLDPRLSQLAGMPIKGALNPGAFDATDTLTGIQRGLTEGAVSVGLQFGIQELELDPLVGALAGNVITGALEGAVTGQGIFQGIGANLQRALGQFAGIGDLSGNPVERATQLAKLNDFSNIVREQGLSTALETYATSIFHRTSVESLVNSYGSVKDAVLRTFASNNADGTKTYDLGGGVSVTVNEATGQITAITEPTETTTGVLEANRDTLTAGLREGVRTYTTADGNRVTIEVKDRVITKIAVNAGGQRVVVSGAALNNLTFTPDGRVYSGTVKDEQTGTQMTFQGGQLVNRLTPAAILVYEPSADPTATGSVRILDFNQEGALLEEVYDGLRNQGQLRLLTPGQAAYSNAPVSTDSQLTEDAKKVRDAIDPPNPPNDYFPPAAEAVPGKDFRPAIQTMGLPPGSGVLILLPGGHVMMTMAGAAQPTMYLAQGRPDDDKPPPSGGDQPQGPNLWQRLWDRWRNGGQNVKIWNDLKEQGFKIDYDQLYKYTGNGNIAAKDVQITRTNYNEVVIRYGNRESVKVRADGSVEKGTFATPIEGLTPEQVRTKLSTEQRVDGYWKIRVPESTRVRRGIVQPESRIEGSTGGLPELIIEDDLPAGSAEWVSLS